MLARRLGVAATTTMFFLAPAGAAEDVPQTSNDRVVAALQNVMTLERAGQDGVATVWDGNKYVQCRFADHAFRCEAAGVLMQRSLANVLGPAQITQLTDRQWRLDPHFGNYVQTFPAGLPATVVAGTILKTLAEGYGADLAQIEVRTDWIDREPCPPRNGPDQNLAGAIMDAPTMAATAIHACSYLPRTDVEPGSRAASAEDLIEAYGGRVAGEIERLRVNADRNVFFILDTGAGYVQCAPDAPPAALYCEAQSAEEWPVLARMLTPDRIAQLHGKGYSDPGRAPNYWQLYDAKDFDAQIVAKSLLTILFEVYGYDGVPKLAISTESGNG